MKIIDCFPFFDEEQLLILRIKLLQNHVDKFVICEANKTHSGIDKEYKCLEILKKHNLYSDKTLVLQIELTQSNNWDREREQRNAASKLIQDDEVWFIGDCDEIINPSHIKTLTNSAITHPDNIVRVPMSFHLTRADLCVYNNDDTLKKWNAPFFCLKNHVQEYTLSELREAETLNTNIKYKNLNINNIAGWHLSWMGDGDTRVKKLKSFMHANDIVDNGIGLLSTNEAEQYVKNFDPSKSDKDVLGRSDHVLKPYPIDSLPKLILEDQQLYSFFLPLKMQHIYQRKEFGEEWFTYPKLYKSIVDKFPTNSRFVEVGSWKGKSSAFMCVEIANSNKNIEFFCVDTWAGSIEHQDHEDLDKLYLTFLDNMKPVEKFYFPLKLTSKEASKKFKDESLDFVFIDASHEYEDVIEDLKIWFPKVKKGGILAGHDCYPNNPEWGGVHKAVKETFTNFTVTDENCFIVEKTDTLDSLLKQYISTPNNPEINFNMAVYYHNIGQTASAISYYLRAAERTDDELIRYECLLRAGICFESQGCRNNSVEGMLQHAVALAPHRPEGYYYLSRFYEHAQKWSQCYFVASIGEKVATKEPSKLKTPLDYPGFYGIIFEKAVSAWWVGLCAESKDIFKYLLENEPLNDAHKQAILNNLNRIK